MAICSGDDQIRTVLFRRVIEVTRVRFAHVDTHVSFAFHAMILQIFGDVADTPSRQILFIRRANLENRHVRRLSEKRQSVTDRKAGLSRVFPADDPIFLQFVHMLGYQNGRSPHSDRRAPRTVHVLLGTKPRVPEKLQQFQREENQQCCPRHQRKVVDVQHAELKQLAQGWDPQAQA